ncbi:hypothetical protein IQK56_04740 [Pseudomonas sp. MAFF 301449]|jgi:hypothetical protein|uniref:Uncharacterized protein n=1 Tax=Pseudomonas cyclaminis TaxID=2781239 RepID=A0ABR9SN20_9PSED|nr:hypothetical protein [Pseudomonas cyclaminis]MBE8590288.1 hypothetical protein [Pseudomonas cyclaminis]MBE8600794.1 hypothetical protein [Pseudomonas cyclaminis]
MSRQFDFEVFLIAVLKGSHATRQRHLRQSKRIQKAIEDRWKRDNPWSWRQKHLAWFMNSYLLNHGAQTRYYYLLTIRLIALRLGKEWHFPQAPNAVRTIASDSPPSIA